MPPSAVTIALLFPDLLGTYGDGGNATILAQRLRWRGIPAEVVTIRSGDPVPAQADLYVVGGGEDLPQALAARQLATPDVLRRSVDRGAVVFAVCAGLQILGTEFHVGGASAGTVGPADSAGSVGSSGGERSAGLGLVDVATAPGTGPRAVGELVVDPGASTGLPALTGYENHGGVTTLGPGVDPLGRVRSGVGNGAGDVDGFVAGHVLGTYLHGPALARNPALADLLLGWVVGELSPLDDTDSERLRTERFRAAATQASAGAPKRKRGLARR